MRWRKPDIEKPQDGQECMFEYKHGYISGEYRAGDNVGYTYIWHDQEYYIIRWMPIEEFLNTAEDAGEVGCDVITG